MPGDKAMEEAIAPSLDKLIKAHRDPDDKYNQLCRTILEEVYHAGYTEAWEG